jgi:signal transduction histidine kinase
LKSSGSEIEAASTGSNPPPAAVPAGSRPPAPVAEHRQVSEVCGATDAEIEHGRQEPDQCCTTVDRLRQELAGIKAASEAKSVLITELSHELLTPLNAIIGLSEIMHAESYGPVGNQTYREYVDDIIFCGRHLLDIVNTTLDVARYEAGKIELHEESAAIDEVVDDAFRLIAPLADLGKVVLLRPPVGGESPRLYCDRLRVRQILVNILSNAVKFTEPGGQVELAIDLSDGLALTVKDTGVGIDPADTPMAMARFGRIATEGSQHRPGAGLGLTLAKALTEQHGGSLSLHSAPQVGTTIRIWFPPERLTPGNSDDSGAGTPLAV